MRYLPRLRKVKIKSPLTGISTSDRNILLLCLGIAFFFWIIVKLSSRYQATKVARLEYLLPIDKAMTVTPPATVIVRLESTGWNLLFEFLSGNELDVEYDLQSLTSFSLTPSQLRTAIKRNLSSGDINILELSFEGLQFELEQRSQKRLPIQLIDSITYAPNFNPPGPVRLIPDSVLVSGPQSTLNALKYWPTDSLLVQNLDRDEEVIVPLQPPSEGLNIMPNQVQVELRVEEFTQKEIWLPVQVRNAPADSIHLFPAKVQASVVVGLSDFDRVSVDSFTLVADLKGASLDDGKNTVPLELRARPKMAKAVQLKQRSAIFYIVRPQIPEDN